MEPKNPQFALLARTARVYTSQTERRWFIDGLFAMDGCDWLVSLTESTTDPNQMHIAVHVITDDKDADRKYVSYGEFIGQASTIHQMLKLLEKARNQSLDLSRTEVVFDCRRGWRIICDVVDYAMGYGWRPRDKAEITAAIGRLKRYETDGSEDTDVEILHDAFERAEQWLNERTVGGWYVFDNDFYYGAICETDTADVEIWPMVLQYGEIRYR